MTTVRQHERQKPRKPDTYVNTHLALLSRRADKIAFLQRHGIPLVDVDDQRLSVPIPEPVEGGMSNTWIIERIRQLAEMMARIGRD